MTISARLINSVPIIIYAGLLVTAGASRSVFAEQPSLAPTGAAIPTAANSAATAAPAAAPFAAPPAVPSAPANPASPAIAGGPRTVGTLGTTFDLVTESEAETWNTTAPKEATDFRTRDLREDGGTPSCRSTADNDADNPKIKIVEPTIEKPLIAPIDIDLQFVPTHSARVRPDSFRVCYMGLVTMDITRRITDHVSVTEKGLHVSGAVLPRGHHRLVFLLADERGRLARREAVFNVL